MSLVFLIDFDGTIVKDDRPYNDVTTPLEFIEIPDEGHVGYDAKTQRAIPFTTRDALVRLKDAGHKLVLWSARASPRLTKDPRLDLVWGKQRRPPRDDKDWRARLRVNRARHQQMIQFVNDHLEGIFDAVDDGTIPGKPSFDVLVDDKAAGGLDWGAILRRYAP